MIESLDPHRSGGLFAPLAEHFWVFLLVASTTPICIEIPSGHRPIRQQSFARSLLFAIASPLAGLAMLSTMFTSVAQRKWAQLCRGNTGSSDILLFHLPGCRIVAKTAWAVVGGAGSWLAFARGS